MLYLNCLAKNLGTVNVTPFLGSGFYIYHEATTFSNSTLDIALNLEESKNYCLRFAYHMYGQYVGSLEVLLNDVTLWQLSGDKGNQWHMAEFLFQFIRKQSDVRLFINMSSLPYICLLYTSPSPRDS